MEVHLIIFTLLSQICVGTFLILWVTDFAARKLHNEVIDMFARSSTIILIPSIIVGMGASLFHLGHPMEAFRAVTNFTTSWLSREIVLFNVFLVLVSFYIYLWWRKMEDSELRRLIGVATGIVGIVAVFSSGMIYQLPSHPGWNHWTNIASFFVSTLLMGGAVTAAIYRIAHKRLTNIMKTEAEKYVVFFHQRNASLNFSILSIIHIILIFIYFGYLSTAGEAGIQSMTHFFSTYKVLFLIRFVLGLAIPIILSLSALFFLYRKLSFRAEVLLTIAVVFILIGEVCGRALFFATAVPLPVG